MKVILINGARGSGKDTAARLMHRFLPSPTAEKFAYPIKEFVKASFSISQRRWDILDSLEHKTKPCEELLGLTPVDVQIHFSEDFLKPMYDQSIFGKLLVTRLHKHRAMGYLSATVSDSGFVPEAEEVIDAFGVENVMLIGLKRDGCNYAGDSRADISLLHMGVHKHRIENNGTIEDLEKELFSAYCKFHNRSIPSGENVDVQV